MDKNGVAVAYREGNALCLVVLSTCTFNQQNEKVWSVFRLTSSTTLHHELATHYLQFINFTILRLCRAKVTAEIGSKLCWVVLVRRR